MRCRRTRDGVTLLEIVVALPMVALLMSACTLLLFATLRGLGAEVESVGARLDARRTTVMLTRTMASLRARDVHAVTDTMVEIAEHQGVGMLCDTGTSGRLVVVWPHAVQPGEGARPGDLLELWGLADSAGAMPRRIEREVRATQLTIPVAQQAAACGAVSGVWLLVTVDSIDHDLLPGGPVLVRRRQRYLQYRSGSAWWIGRRTFDGASWDGTQPVAGPVDSPRDHGMTMVPGWRQGTDSGDVDALILMDIAMRRALPGGATVRMGARVPIVGGSSPARATMGSWRE